MTIETPTPKTTARPTPMTILLAARELMGGLSRLLMDEGHSLTCRIADMT
jgi:hypothetical protein